MRVALEHHVTEGSNLGQLERATEGAAVCLKEWPIPEDTRQHQLYGEASSWIVQPGSDCECAECKVSARFDFVWFLRRLVPSRVGAGASLRYLENVNI